MNPSYSIYIRTLGIGGDKYKSLLKSISIQTIPPNEVVVVLPYGYPIPKEQLGDERFAFSEKGMIKQRLFAIEDAKTEYILLLDDDVKFEAEFVEKEFLSMQKAKATCCISQMEKDRNAKKSTLKKILNHIIGSEVHKNTKDNYLYKINKAGGFITNTHIDLSKPVYSQTGHGSNCLCKVSDLRSINFEEELWLESSGYALPDDQVMFYKLFLQGTSIAVCTNTKFQHLDAATTNDGKRQLRIAQAKAGNYLIFWYRFIYRRNKGFGKITAIVAIIVRNIMECLLYALKCHDPKVIKSICKGWIFAVSYIHNH